MRSPCPPTPVRIGLSALLMLLAATAATAADPRITTDGSFAVVSRTDGSVVAWGRGSDGELGNGGRNSSSVPVPVSGVGGIVDVVASRGLAMALKLDGTVWVWGSGAFGVFGTAAGNVIRSVTPVQIPELQGITAIRLGRGGPSAFAVDVNGRVFQWGTNSRGEFGSGVAGGTAEVRMVPQPIPALSGIRALAATDKTFIAAAADGQVYGWGYNPLGGLGIATLAPLGGQPLPVTRIPGTGEAVALAAMDVNDSAHFALRRDGTVAAWGTNSGGQAGCGQVPGSAATLGTPRVIQRLDGVSATTGGAGHVLFLRGNGEVLGCGNGRSGELGDGTTAGTSELRQGPVAAVLPPGVAMRAIGAGGIASAGVSADGRVWVWGGVSEGLAGDGGPTTGSASVRQILSPQTVVGPGGPGTLDAGAAATAPALYGGTLTGSLLRATVSVGVAPAAADVGRTGRVYLVALLPDGSFFANAGGAAWVPWSGGPIPVYAAGTLPRHVPMPLFRDADLRFAEGISLYTGYGVGATDEAAQADLLGKVKYGVAVTLR